MSRREIHDVSTGQAGEAILEVHGLTQRLWDAERREEFVVSVAVPIRILPGTFATLLGPSGCGKTTLLSVLGLLRRPSRIDDHGYLRMTIQTDHAREHYDVKGLWTRNQQHLVEELRRRHVGFSLQSGELLPSMTVSENLSVPLSLNGLSKLERDRRVDELLHAFGFHSQREECELDGRPSIPWKKSSRAGRTPLQKLAHARINKLSGGEYQRVALARAIAHRPALVFVDEPTANLNRELARHALAQLKNLLAESRGRTSVIMITHDVDLSSEFADLIIQMAPVRGRAAGEVVEVTPNAPSFPVVSQAGGLIIH